MQPFAARYSLHVNDVCASRRQSFAGRISHRVASRLSFVGTPVETRFGTVTGTIINTLCSVIGAGVLSLPLALYFSSIVVGLMILLLFSASAAFSVYCLVVGCDATGRYSLPEVMAFTLYPPQLWEEYLCSRGATDQSSREEDAPRLAKHQCDAVCVSSGVCSSSRNKESGVTGSPHTGATAGTGTRQSRGPGENMANKEGEGDTSQYRHHPRRQDDQPYSGTSDLHGSTDRESNTPFPIPPMSTYAGLRDAYAREEWRRRHRRRLITTLMELMVFCSNYGTLVVYSKVIADSMPPVVSYFTPTDGVLVSKYFWLIAGGIVFFVLSCAHNMEELKWSSLLGFLSIFYIVVLILYRYHTQQRYDYPHVDPRRYGQVRWFHFSFSVLRTISTFGMALSYHYNVPYLYKELQDRRPNRMMQSLLVAFPIIIVCYAVTGIFGYLTFGDQVAAPKVGGNIVSNYPKDDLFMNIGRLGLFAHFACVFPVLSICTRRGLHRLTMIALTWTDQSILMKEAARASGAQLTETEQDAGGITARLSSASATLASANDDDREDDTHVYGHAPGETSPLLQRHGTSTPGYEVFARSSPLHLAALEQHSNAELESSSNTNTAAAGGLRDHLLTSANSAGQPQGTHPTPELPGTVDVDRDVGSPDQTTLLAIVVEAAFLVCTSVLIAATVSGIDFVIQLIGTLFSVFNVMVAPGMVGWCVFSPRGPFGSASAAAAAYRNNSRRLSDAPLSGVSSRFRLIRLKRFMCLMNAVCGLCMTSIGIAMLVYDTF
ncbi:putative Transmembrane amino acid transporter protein [Leishmania utingensis]|uniref:Transmembrane amino acid transporter protein n=1 Tax=Leishmania utingensis TaxID=653362 RepID=A0AAW2ZVT2_9TRYP